jgi:hypothetical protein
MARKPKVEKKVEKKAREIPKRKAVKDTERKKKEEAEKKVAPPKVINFFSNLFHPQ